MAARRISRPASAPSRRCSPATAVEALTPDFQGVLRDVETVVDSGLEVFAQNVETVRRLTHPVRDPRAGYEQTLDVLAHAKRHRPAVLTKTSLMLGLGETDDEILADDGRSARRAGGHADTRAIPAPDGQSPAGGALRHAGSSSTRYRERALARGFRECVSGPLVRSSYRAEQALHGNNAGLDNAGLAAAAAPPPTR